MGVRERRELELLKKQRQSIDQQIARLENAEKTGFFIRNVHEIESTEKIDQFNKVYEMAVADLREVEKDGQANEDNAHYIYEAVLSWLTPSDKTVKEFWDYYNRGAQA